jgi:hypothetical protein
MDFPAGLLAYDVLDNDYDNYIHHSDNGLLVDCSLQFRGDEGRSNIQITKVNENKTYIVTIAEHISKGGHFVANGIVVIDPVTGSFVVNGVPDGCLHDKYQDCFDLKPEVYKHFFGFPQELYNDK